MIIEYPREKICLHLSLNSMNIYWELFVDQALFGYLLLHHE